MGHSVGSSMFCQRLLDTSSSNSIPFFICDTPKKPMQPIEKQQHDQINTHLPIPPGTFESMIFPTSRYRWHMFSRFPGGFPNTWKYRHLESGNFQVKQPVVPKMLGFFETKHHRNQASKNLFRHQGTVNTKSLPKSSSSTSTEMNSSKPSTENLIRIRLTTAVKLTRESSLLPSLRLYNSKFTPEDRLIFPQRKYVVWTNHPFSGALAAGFREGINLVFFVVFLLMPFIHPTHRCDEVNMVDSLDSWRGLKRLKHHVIWIDVSIMFHTYQNHTLLFGKPIAGWCFQPIWKILVNMGIFPK